MTHVIQIDTEICVVGVDTGKRQAQPGPEAEPSWEEMAAAIDQRANYVGPVLEHLLHLDHDARPWTLRE